MTTTAQKANVGTQKALGEQTKFSKLFLINTKSCIPYTFLAQFEHFFTAFQSTPIQKKIYAHWKTNRRLFLQSEQQTHEVTLSLHASGPNGHLSGL